MYNYMFAVGCVRVKICRAYSSKFPSHSFDLDPLHGSGDGVKHVNFS